MSAKLAQRLLAALLGVIVAGCGLVDGFFEIATVETTTSLPTEGASRVEAAVQMDEGDLRISGGTDQLMTGRFTHHSESRPDIVLATAGEEGELTITQPDRGVRDADDWNLLLNPDVEFDLNVLHGAGTTELDLSELNVSTLDANLGAGEATINLAGATTDAHVSLGAGDVTFDLTRLTEQDSRVQVERGAGSVELLVPEAVTVVVNVEQALGSVDAEGFEQTGSRLVHTGSTDPDTTLQVEVQGAVGEVELRLVGAEG